MNDNFMKTKPVLPLLLSLALPMMLSMLVNSLYNIIDSFFVAKISEDAMTALSLVFPIQNFINAVAIGFGIGINAVVAYFLGAGDKKSANQATTLGIILAIIHGILLTAGSILLIPYFLKMFSHSENVISLGIEYSNIVFAFSLIIMLNVGFEKIFQSVGKMKVTMFSMMAGSITNIILDPLLIFGIGPFPRMEIKGAAIATNIGQLVCMTIYLLIFIFRPIQVKIQKKYATLDFDLIKRLYAVGIPATLNLALPSLLISALNAILASFSGVYVLILGVYYKLQTFLYLPANGIIQGMRPVIGFNYGAREYKRVKKIYKIVLRMSAGIMLAGTLICFIIPDVLIGLFTTNPETIEAGKTALRIFRCFRRSGKRSAVLNHFTLSIHSCNYPCCFSFITSSWCSRCLACFLGIRSNNGNRIFSYLSKNSKTKLDFYLKRANSQYLYLFLTICSFFSDF